jgi:hypothetical protein
MKQYSKEKDMRTENGKEKMLLFEISTNIGRFSGWDAYRSFVPKKPFTWMLWPDVNRRYRRPSVRISLQCY